MKLTRQAARWLLLMGAPLLSGCVGWLDAVPRGLQRELRAWEPAPVTTATVAFGLKTNLPAWSFTEHEEIERQYAPIVSSLFPHGRAVAPAVASMFGPADWPGDHDYAVRVQYHWNGCAAVTTAGFSYGVDSTRMAAGAADMGAGGAQVFLYGAGASMAMGGEAGLYLAAGMLGLSGLSLAGGIGLAFALTGIGLALNIVLPHYYQLPVTATLDVFDRRHGRTSRLVVGVIGSLLVWPPLAFLRLGADAPWDPAMRTVVRWSMKALAEQELWEGIYPPEAEVEPEPEWSMLESKASLSAPGSSAEGRGLPKAWPLPPRLRSGVRGEPSLPLERILEVGPRRAGDCTFEVTLAPGATLLARAAFHAEQGDIDLELFDAQGRAIAFSRSTGSQERIEHQAGAHGGVYRLHVYGLSGGEPQRCRLRLDVTELSPRAIASPQRYTGQIESAAAPGRIYAFQVDVGQTVHFDLSFRHAEGDLDLELADASGQTLVVSQGTLGLEQIVYTAHAAGLVYLRVYAQRRSGPYTLDVR